VAVQGFGNVGSIAAKLFAANRRRMVAVQDHTGTILNESGMDMPATCWTTWPRPCGRGRFCGRRQHLGREFWDVKSDVLIPAALEGQITAERAQRISTRIVLEGANGPTTPDGRHPGRPGIIVVPDVIANSGGVTVSYFEWVQDFSLLLDRGRDQRAPGQDHHRRLQGHLGNVEQHRISLRTAAFVVACTRVLQAREERGLYP
jgi:glutamate dehydrogenase (NAD(P)+)